MISSPLIVVSKTFRSTPLLNESSMGGCFPSWSRSGWRLFLLFTSFGGLLLCGFTIWSSHFSYRWFGTDLQGVKQLQGLLQCGWRTTLGRDIQGGSMDHAILDSALSPSSKNPWSWIKTMSPVLLTSRNSPCFVDHECHSILRDIIDSTSTSGWAHC